MDFGLGERKEGAPGLDGSKPSSQALSKSLLLGIVYFSRGVDFRFGGEKLCWDSFCLDKFRGESYYIHTVKIVIHVGTIVISYLPFG